MQTLSKETIVEFLASIFENRGAEEYLGEPVTIGEHMLQGATMAENDGQSDEIIVAARLHDIGHFTSDIGTFELNDTLDRQHEDAGAKVLEPFFPTVVTDCCRYHVAAKRYLCATKPEYFEKLSDASVQSLKLQGGPMNAQEIAEFEQNPNLEAIITVRFLDEAAKIPGMQTPKFDYFAPRVQKMIDAHTA